MDPISLIKEMSAAIIAVKNATQEFNSQMDTLTMYLDELTPAIEFVIKYEKKMGDQSNNDDQTVERRRHIDDLVKKLNEGRKLLEKCAKLSLLQKLIGCYKRQLEKLNTSVSLQLSVWKWKCDMIVSVKPVSSIPEPPKFIVGWREAVGELKHRLLEEEEFPVIGICGPGGCGKSTLAKKLCEQVKASDKFDRISYIMIPRSPDSPTEKKEEETVNLIGVFEKLWDDLVGTPRPAFESAGGALEQLKQRLDKEETQGKGRLLIVLDGVRSDNMLGKLVVKAPRLKTLVTSREKLKGLNWSYWVRELNMDDATNLFLYHASPQSRFRTSKDKDKKLVVKQIVEGCKFHPLALKLIGASLQGAPYGKWKTTAERLLHKEGQIFEEVDQEIFWPLYTRLESLETAQRECFMDLICFPDNNRIRAAALMDMWVHTRGQKEADAYEMLKILADRHLIELFKRRRNETTDLDESFSDLFVAQQDLLREFAVYVSEHKKLPKMKFTRLIINEADTFPDSVRKEDTISQAQIVSVRTGASVNSDGIDVQFPRAEVLILNFSRSTYCLHPLLSSMKNLKVLVIANHSMAAAVLSGLPPSGSLESLAAVKLERISLPIDCTLAEPLKGVRKLSLILCKVKNEEQEIFSGGDIQTMFPDLTELEIDYCNGLERLPTAVCNIVNLQKLSITNCHDLVELPRELDGLSKLEVLRLSSCTSLERLPYSLSKLGKLRFLDLFSCSSLGRLPEDINMLKSLEKMDLRTCLARLPDKVKHFEGLRDVICDENARTLWERIGAECGTLEVHGYNEFMSLNFLR